MLTKNKLKFLKNPILFQLYKSPKFKFPLRILLKHNTISVKDKEKIMFQDLF